MRAKRIMYAEYVKTFDSSESIANMLFSSAVDGIDVFLDYTVLSAITFEDVEEQFKKAFCEEYMTLSVVNPMDTHQSDQT